MGRKKKKKLNIIKTIFQIFYVGHKSSDYSCTVLHYYNFFIQISKWRENIFIYVYINVLLILFKILFRITNLDILHLLRSLITPIKVSPLGIFSFSICYNNQGVKYFNLVVIWEIEKYVKAGARHALHPIHPLSWPLLRTSRIIN